MGSRNEMGEQSVLEGGHLRMGRANITTDTDGLCIEWKNIHGTSECFHHLQVIPDNPQKLQPIYRLLKKHLKRSECNQTAHGVLQNCV
jgi:hypothetical protein